MLCRFEIQRTYSDNISYRDYSRQTRVFDHQAWSARFNCWVSRPGFAARSRTLFKREEYVKSDAAPMKRLS